MTSSLGSATKVHDEDVEIVESLAKLQQIHQQIFDLRTLLPNKLIGPARDSLKEPRKVSPQKLASTISQAARKGTSDIQQFKKDWHDEKTREAFQKSSSSQVPQGVDAWMVDYPALLASTKGNSATTNDTTNDSASQEDFLKTVNQFKEGNSGMTVTLAGETDPFPLKLEFSGLHLEVTKDATLPTFRLAPQQNDKDSVLAQQICQQVNNAEVWADLSKLLNMIASYQDIKTRHCNNCKELYDVNLELPIVRKQKAKSSTDEESSSWEALHLSCGRFPGFSPKIS